VVWPSTAFHSHTARMCYCIEPTLLKASEHARKLVVVTDRRFAEERERLLEKGSTVGALRRCLHIPTVSSMTFCTGKRRNSHLANVFAIFVASVGIVAFARCGFANASSLHATSASSRFVSMGRQQESSAAVRFNSAEISGIKSAILPSRAHLDGTYGEADVSIIPKSDCLRAVYQHPLQGGGNATAVVTKGDNEAAALKSRFGHCSDFTESQRIDVTTVNTFYAIAALSPQLTSNSESLAVSHSIATPRFSLSSGIYNASQRVSIKDTTVGITCYYTIDGSIPTTSSAVYSKPLVIDQTTTINAIAVNGSLESSVAYVTIIIATATAVQPVPSNSSFTPPTANACQSAYDQFYIAEPGVYAYWALCELGSNPAIYDYAGRFDLSPANGAWSSVTGTILGGAPGPVPDDETADQVSTGSSFVTDQDIPMNSNEGTLAVWTNTDSIIDAQSMLTLQAVGGNSGVQIAAVTPSSDECFLGTFMNSGGSAFSTPAACGYTKNSWHRVVFTWTNGTLMLYIDGLQVAATQYSGILDNKVFYYRLFPQFADTRKQMTLAKASVANQAWSGTQVATDYAPILPAPPSGGVYVTSEQLGEIHRDVLGYVDNNEDISNPSVVSSLDSGLSSAGISSIRYASGYAGIAADTANWQGGPSCGATSGTTVAAANVSTQDDLDNFVAQVAKPIGATLGYTVNYGTNPPACNAGGDPVVNGASLVQYANNEKNYGIKYWEIGNELYDVGAGGNETDFHPSPGNGASYAKYEQAFHDDMKAQNNTILIGIPVADGDFGWLQDWTLPAMQAASYDAVVFHSYPMNDPITDGQTLYPERVTSNMARLRGSMLALQTELLNVNKSPDAIWITEWDGSAYGALWSRQTMGAAMPMFAAMQLGEYLQAGVQYATWHAQSVASGCYLYNYDWNGESAYNWWDCGGSFIGYSAQVQGEIAVGLKPGDLSPEARAFQLLSQSAFVTEGEHMLRVFTDVQQAPWLVAYAATHGSAHAVILINRDRDSTHAVPVQFEGIAAGSSVQQWSYGRPQYDLTKAGNWSAGPLTTSQAAWNQQAIVQLPPWSINVIIVK
jgi:hypothetical protein